MDAGYCAHHLAAIFEDLNGGDPVAPSEFDVLFGPGVDHVRDLLHSHACDRQAVVRKKADDPANAPLGFCDEKALAIFFTSFESGFSAAKSLSKTNVLVY